jgi:hypothetical protein
MFVLVGRVSQRIAWSQRDSAKAARASEHSHGKTTKETHVQLATKDQMANLYSYASFKEA